MTVLITLLSMAFFGIVVATEVKRREAKNLRESKDLAETEAYFRKIRG